MFVLGDVDGIEMLTKWMFFGNL